MSLTNKVPEKDVHDLFTRVAPHYDQMNNLISLGTQNGWRKKFFKKLKVKAGDFALDLCCGTGDLTIALAKQVGPSGNVIGLDFNQKMLDLADKKIRAQNLQKEISELQKKRKEIIEKASNELKKKIRKEWIKLIVSSVTLVSILYYLVKIKLMKRFLSREPQEAKDIAKQIKEKEDQLKKLRNSRIRNILLSPFRRAKA